MKLFDVIAAILLVIGGLNWGLVAIAEMDLVAQLCGGATMPLARIIYGLVGLSALYQIFQWKAIQCRWNCHQ